ncbi:response regulator [Marinifilum sp. N1E240]|uniref:response regulator transcription factor n=1 Tax=Marinifilum sp. N1E240 TaxID=2608082 RepID=UPI00128D3715|nr:response regulator transcription factor [Marinifilum sp. N1E240]MPQ48595.1 response regulator [Marinifilum sp. N1E240]
MKRILLLEDDRSFGYILSEYLSMQEFQVVWVQTGEEVLKILENDNFDLALLDVMLPGIDGYELAKILMKKHDDLPFLFLSAKSLKIDKLKGFKLGAIDFITKPIDEELLVAKINAILNQAKNSKGEDNSIEIGCYEFNPKLFQLKYKEEIIKLTARESELLLMLCEHKNNLLSRKKALNEIWGTNDEFNRKSMDVFISKLRKYLNKDRSITIDNIHGKGFIFSC